MKTKQPETETQDSREQRCHKECDEYFSLCDMTPDERKWLHKGLEFGAKWVDNGDKVII